MPVHLHVLQSSDSMASEAEALRPNEGSNEEPLTREQRRSRRARPVRARTISVKRMTKHELAMGRLLNSTPDDAPQRPRTRGDCAGVARPCPWVSCKHHLYLDVSPRTGSIKLNYPDIEPDEMTHSCALDVADGLGETLEMVGEIMNLTRERIRQLEVKALAKLVATHATDELLDWDEDGPVIARRVLPAVDDTYETDGLESEADDA